MSVNITPAMRVQQYPDEFIVKKNRLICKWCDRVINHCRKDNMNEHMWSRAHQDMRVAKGARMSYDPESADALERRKRRCEKAARSKRRKDQREGRRQQRRRNTQSQSSSDDGDHDDDNNDLRQLFQDSDSDSSESFEGFDTTPHQHLITNIRPKRFSETTDEESRRSARSRKRPARLDDSINKDEIEKIGKIADQAAFVSSMARRKRAADDDESSSSDLSPPPRIRSMPIKKRISFNARQSDSTSPITSPTSGSLKMKFSRASADRKRSSAEYTVEKSKKLKVMPSTGPGKGLKLKFVWKKKAGNKTSEDSDSRDTDEDTKRENDGVPKGYEEMLRGITEGAVAEADNQVVADAGEVIEEEIVEMDDLVISEDWVPPEPEAPSEDSRDVELEAPVANIKRESNESNLTNQTTRIKKMAKSIAKGQFKSKKTKKEATVDEKKRKTTGYMLWAKQMREKVSKQYPGLEFGDVSKKLGDLWKKIPDKEKQMWKFRNLKIEKQINMVTFRRSGSKMIETGPKKRPPPPPKTQTLMSLPTVRNPEASMKMELKRLSLPASEPIDSAAYFALLGESFEKLSNKTRKMESKAVIQGAESILLDSLVCALAPLINLTRQIPQLEDALDQRNITETLTNIAHIIPGL